MVYICGTIDAANDVRSTMLDVIKEVGLVEPRNKMAFEAAESPSAVADLDRVIGNSDGCLGPTSLARSFSS